MVPKQGSSGPGVTDPPGAACEHEWQVLSRRRGGRRELRRNPGRALRSSGRRREFGAPLQILHLKPDRTSSDAIADPTAAEMAARRESAEAIVQAAEQAVRAHFKGLHIACAQVVGSAGQALVESSRVARLIVLGTDELSLGTAVLVGSTTMSVAAHSTCPVVAWRGGAISPPDNPSSSE